mgnify:FL=1
MLFKRFSSCLLLLAATSGCTSIYADQTTQQVGDSSPTTTSLVDAKQPIAMAEMPYRQSQQTVCILTTDYPTRSLEQQKQLLINRAETAAIKELFGTSVYAQQAFSEAGQLQDTFVSRARGTIRVKGTPNVFQGQNLGEICASIEAYIIASDLALYEPQAVQLDKFCFNAVNVTMANLRRDANYAAYGELLRRFRPSLQLSGQEAKKYIHEYQVTQEAYDISSSSYCFDVSAAIYPYELDLAPVHQNIIGYIPPANSMTNTRFSNNLLAYWSFDDCSVTDFSNNHRNLSNHFDCVDGVKGKAAHIRQGGFLRSPFIDFNRYNEFSLSFWVKENSMAHKAGTGYIFFGDHTTGGWVGIGNFWGKIQFNVGKVGHPTHAAINHHNSGRYQGAFHHYVLTYKNGVFDAYIDNQFVARAHQRVALPNKNKRAAVGKHYWANGKKTVERLDAVFDEILILNKHLSKAEVEALYLGRY